MSAKITLSLLLNEMESLNTGEQDGRIDSHDSVWRTMRAKRQR